MRVAVPLGLVAYGAPWTENYWFENENPDKDPKLRHFIPTELLGLFDRVAWPAATSTTAARPNTDARVDLRARMRGMWR